MTVRELRQVLENFPQNMQVAYSCCSDYVRMTPDEIVVGNVITQLGRDTLLHHHSTYIPRQGEEVAQFVLFPGN